MITPAPADMPRADLVATCETLDDAYHEMALEAERLRGELSRARERIDAMLDEFDSLHGLYEVRGVELEAVKAKRDALLSAAREVVGTGFFVPAILALREAVEKAGAK